MIGWWVQCCVIILCQKQLLMLLIDLGRVCTSLQMHLQNQFSADCAADAHP